MIKKENLILLGILAVIIAGGLIATAVIFGGEKGSWVCVDNVWVEQGNPRTA